MRLHKNACTRLSTKPHTAQPTCKHHRNVEHTMLGRLGCWRHINIRSLCWAHLGRRHQRPLRRAADLPGVHDSLRPPMTRQRRAARFDSAPDCTTDAHHRRNKGHRELCDSELTGTEKGRTAVQTRYGDPERQSPRCRLHRLLTKPQTPPRRLFEGKRGGGGATGAQTGRRRLRTTYVTQRKQGSVAGAARTGSGQFEMLIGILGSSTGFVAPSRSSPNRWDLS